MSEETSREGLHDGRGARTTAATVVTWRRSGDARSIRRRPCRLTMTSADDEDVDARTTMKTTKATKLRSEGMTQLQLNVDAATRVHQ
uniref:Uncharacterized protein n=1 Tax=Oryza punctata TaxID=4537 RepID=A0A0E0K4T1_ORYPU